MTNKVKGAMRFSYKTLQEMRDDASIGSLSDGDSVEIQGHTVVGTGGGSFYYDASDTTSVDNNGTVVIIDGKRWKRKLEGFVTPEMFGFVTGNDITDNTTAVQKCVTAHSNVVLSEKTDYSIETLTLHSDMTITGCKSTTITCRTSVTLTSLSNISFVGVNFNFAHGYTAGINMLVFNFCTDILVEGCTIDGLGYTGDTADTVGGNLGIKVHDSFDIKIVHCTIRNLKNNWGIQAERTKRLLIDGNTIHHTGRAGVEITSDNQDVIITNNTLDHCKTNHITSDANDGCIDLYGPNNDGVVIKGNTITNGGRNNAFGSGLPAQCTGIRIMGSRNVDVGSNIIHADEGTATVVAVQSRSGITSNGISIHDNSIVLAGLVAYGFRMLEGYGVSFSGNVSRGTDPTGLYNQCMEVRTRAEDVTISGNTFIGFEDGMASKQYGGGIRFHSSGTSFTNVKVTDNIIKSASTNIHLSKCSTFVVSGNIAEKTDSGTSLLVDDTNSDGVISSNVFKRSVNPTTNVDAGAINVVEVNSILAVGPVG